VVAFDQPQARDNEEINLEDNMKSDFERAVESIGIKQPYGVKIL
jgi:hypothetical protein